MSLFKSENSLFSSENSLLKSEISLFSSEIVFTPRERVNFHSFTLREYVLKSVALFARFLKNLLILNFLNKSDL